MFTSTLIFFSVPTGTSTKLLLLLSASTNSNLISPLTGTSVTTGVVAVVVGCVTGACVVVSTGVSPSVTTIVRSSVLSCWSPFLAARVYLEPPPSTIGHGLSFTPEASVL